MTRFALLLPLVWTLVGCAGTTWPLPARADALDALQRRIIQVSQSVSPSVVHIEAAIKNNNRGKLVTGSGFIIDPSGVVVTNWHVVDRARKVSVVVPDRAGRYIAEVVGTDQQTDVAVLRIEARDGEDPFPVTKLGNSDELTVGEWVIAIGNPYGLDGTVSLGIVSGKGRDLKSHQILNDFIQTDAMIDHGSSGGPLLNLNSEVVGVNSRGQGRGIGFTIPINVAKRVADDLLAAGGISRGYLGVAIQPLDRELASFWKMEGVHGVVVGSVTKASPAERAGLRVGDIITHLDGRALSAEQEEDLGNFQRMVAQMKVGQEVELRALRGDQQLTLRTELTRQPKVVPDEEATDFGFTVQELTENLYRRHRLPQREGVMVSFVENGSEAAEARMNNGDVVIGVNDTEVSDIDGFRSALQSLPPGQPFLIKALRGYDTRFMLITPRGGELEASPAGRSKGQS